MHVCVALWVQKGLLNFMPDDDDDVHDKVDNVQNKDKDTYIRGHQMNFQMFR